MKVLLSVLALALLPLSGLATDSIFTAVYKDDESISLQERIVETYEAALKAKEPNALQAAVAALKKEYEGDEIGTVGSPSANDLFLLSSGKGSAVSYGGTYLLGVPTSLNGTGLIEEYGLYVKAYYYLEFAGEGAESEYPKLTVTLEKLVDITDRK